MATNLFSKAAAYRKKHPSVSQAEAVQIVAAEKRAAAKKPAAKKATAKKRAVGKVKPKKVVKKINVRIGRPAESKSKEWARNTMQTKAKDLGLRLVHGYAAEGRARGGMHGMAGVSMAELERQILHLQNLQKINVATRYMLKDKRHKDAWADLRRQLLQNTKMIAATKKHITALKRTI